MSPAAWFEIATVGGSLCCAAIASVVVLRVRSAARCDRIALRLARARESAFVEAARRLADAARAGVDAVRDEIVRAATAVAPALDGVLFYDEHDGVLTCMRAHGERFEYYVGSRIALDDAQAPAARALAARHRITLDDEGVRRIHPADVAVLAVPLGLDRGRASVLVAAARAVLDSETLDRLVTLADQASPAYLIAHEREHDRHRAEYDGLTGLLTPRAFRQRLAQLVDRARFVPAQRFALAFIDTDRFKEWNDAYGHASGDALLRALAEELRGAVRSAHDLVARNGGDEFCIVFAETDKADAIERAERLRLRIAQLDVAAFRPAGAGAAVRITASIGIAAYPADAAGASDVLERADAAMYHAKRAGRDAVAYAAPGGAFALLERRSA